MKLYTFLFINFMVGFMSDIILNDLSYLNNSVLSSLRSYFKNKGIIEAGIYAGLTILIATIVLTTVTEYLFGFVVPSNRENLIKALIIGYILGFIIDKLIEKLNIFGSSLNEFYDKVGSGNSGALSFVFSIALSYFIQKNIIPLL